MARLVRDFPEQEFRSLFTRSVVKLPSDTLQAGRSSITHIRVPDGMSVNGKSGYAQGCWSGAMVVYVNGNPIPTAVVSVLCGGERPDIRNERVFDLLRLFQASAENYNPQQSEIAFLSTSPDRFPLTGRNGRQARSLAR